MDEAQAQQLLTDALDLGDRMLSCGAEVGRVEDTITRILNAGGVKRVDVFTITSNIEVTAHWDFGPITQIRRIESISYDMTALSRLNALSRDICSGECPRACISQRLEEISHGPQYSLPASVGIYFLSSFAFSLFFGGSLVDALLSGAIGMVIRLLLLAAGRLLVPGIAANLLCAIAGGFLAHGFSWMGIPCSPDQIAIGDIMLLVPGIPMTNAVRDMFTGDTISGLLRFTESALISLALAWGFALPSLLG